MKTDSVKDISIEDYSYALPKEKIAQQPLAQRDASKLLVYNRGNISDLVFRDIPDQIPANSLLIVNDSKVIHARLQFQTSTGAQIEILLLEPCEPAQIELAMAARGSASWLAYVGNARRWRTDSLTGKFEGVEISVHKLEVVGDSYKLRLSWSGGMSFGQLLERVGHVPLPPYMKRTDEGADKERYQTVYAHAQGSVAAPTAGLHFTLPVIAALKERGVQIAHVTLHVGAGTFQSVKGATIAQHLMHQEHIVVSRDLILSLRDAVKSSKTIVCVGTTSVRTVESLYWMGVKLSELHLRPSMAHDLAVHQWDPYEPENIELKNSLSSVDSLTAILSHLDATGENSLRTTTQLLIAPGYSFRFVNMLVTNFHVPRSTLLLLVAAFIGEDWRRVYEHALHNGYRFLSYGDSSLLIPDMPFTRSTEPAGAKH